MRKWSAGGIVAEGTRRQNLESHITLKLLIAGAIDHAHSTGANLFQDAVMAEVFGQSSRRGPILEGILGCAGD